MPIILAAPLQRRTNPPIATRCVVASEWRLMRTRLNPIQRTTTDLLVTVRVRFGSFSASRDGLKLPKAALPSSELRLLILAIFLTAVFRSSDGGIPSSQSTHPVSFRSLRLATTFRHTQRKRRLLSRGEHADSKKLG